MLLITLPQPARRFGARVRRSLQYRWEVATLTLRRQAVLRWLLFRKSQFMQVTTQPTIIFSPHQDDETLGCGGLIALKRQQGIPVWVVFVTGGDACYHDRSVPLSKQEIVELRQQEAIAALNTLGVDADHIRFLNQPDLQLSDLAPEDKQSLLLEIQQILHQYQPQEIYVPYREDGHPDHAATHRLVKAAFQASGIQADFWQYLVWALWHSVQLDTLTPQEVANLHRLTIRPVQATKQAALKVYKSQYAPIAPEVEPTLPKGFLKFFFSPHELYVKS